MVSKVCLKRTPDPWGGWQRARTIVASYLDPPTRSPERSFDPHRNIGLVPLLSCQRTTGRWTLSPPGNSLRSETPPGTSKAKEHFPIRTVGVASRRRTLIRHSDADRILRCLPHARLRPPKSPLLPRSRPASEDPEPVAPMTKQPAPSSARARSEPTPRSQTTVWTDNYRITATWVVAWGINSLASFQDDRTATYVSSPRAHLPSSCRTKIRLADPPAPSSAMRTFPQSQRRLRRGT